jgi:tetratricopeptide (TPR) repeat protein
MSCFFVLPAFSKDEVDYGRPQNFFYDGFYPDDEPELSKNYDRAVSCFEKKDIRKSLFYLNNMIKYSQFSKEGLNLYGVVSLYCGDYENSAEFFRKAINADKKYKFPYMNLGILYVRKQRWRDLEAIAGRYLEIDEADFDANLGMGIAAFNLYCYKDAERYFDAAWELRKNCVRSEYLELLDEYRGRARARNRRLF